MNKDCEPDYFLDSVSNYDFLKEFKSKTEGYRGNVKSTIKVKVK